MTTSSATAPVAPARTKPRGHATHRRAIAAFIAPFALLYVAFYLVPIVYAMIQSLMTVERDGTFGVARQVFGGLAQYTLVF